MKPIRITTAHQSITFSRRMLMLGGAQAAVGGLLVGRLGWLAIAQNEKYQLLSESNRVQLIPVPPRRGWIIDRNGKPIAINKASFRVDIIPQQLEKGRDIVPEVAKLLELDDGRCRSDQARAGAVARLPAGLGRRQCPLRSICGDHRPPARPSGRRRVAGLHPLLSRRIHRRTAGRLCRRGQRRGI